VPLFFAKSVRTRTYKTKRNRNRSRHEKKQTRTGKINSIQKPLEYYAKREQNIPTLANTTFTLTKVPTAVMHVKNPSLQVAQSLRVIADGRVLMQPLKERLGMRKTPPMGWCAPKSSVTIVTDTLVTFSTMDQQTLGCAIV
jgi:AAA15 family ATPase/GTPase